MPSLRSLTVAGVNSVAGSRCARRGRKRSSHVVELRRWQARAACTPLRSAPTRENRRRPAPTPGSPRRSRTRSSAFSRSSVVAARRPPQLSAYSSASASANARVEMRADADRIGRLGQELRKRAHESRRPSGCKRAGPPASVVSRVARAPRPASAATPSRTAARSLPRNGCREILDLGARPSPP